MLLTYKIRKNWTYVHYDFFIQYDVYYLLYII